MSSPGPIASFLEAFAGRLAVAPARRRRILREVEDHLHDAAEVHVANGSSTADAEHLAIANFGPPVAAADLFGTDLIGLACRFLLRLLPHRRNPTRAAPFPGAEERRTSLPPPACDICGKAVSDIELFHGDLSAVGDMQAPVPLMLHRTCYEMGEALLATRGMPVVVTPGQRSRG